MNATERIAEIRVRLTEAWVKGYTPVSACDDLDYLLDRVEVLEAENNSLRRSLEEWRADFAALSDHVEKLERVVLAAKRVRGDMRHFEDAEDISREWYEVGDVGAVAELDNAFHALDTDGDR